VGRECLQALAYKQHVLTFFVHFSLTSPDIPYSDALIEGAGDNQVALRVEVAAADVVGVPF